MSLNSAVCTAFRASATIVFKIHHKSTAIDLACFTVQMATLQQVIKYCVVIEHGSSVCMKKSLTEWAPHNTDLLRTFSYLSSQKTCLHFSNSGGKTIWHVKHRKTLDASCCRVQSLRPRTSHCSELKRRNTDTAIHKHSHALKFSHAYISVFVQSTAFFTSHTLIFKACLDADSSTLSLAWWGIIFYIYQKVIAQSAFTPGLCDNLLLIYYSQSGLSLSSIGSKCQINAWSRKSVISHERQLFLVEFAFGPSDPFWKEILLHIHNWYVWKSSAAAITFLNGCFPLFFDRRNPP